MTWTAFAILAMFFIATEQHGSSCRSDNGTSSGRCVRRLVAEAEEKADEAVEMMEEAEDMVATSATCSFSIFELASHAP